MVKMSVAGTGVWSLRKLKVRCHPPDYNTLEDVIQGQRGLGSERFEVLRHSPNYTDV